MQEFGGSSVAVGREGAWVSLRDEGEARTYCWFDILRGYNAQRREKRTRLV